MALRRLFLSATTQQCVETLCALSLRLPVLSLRCRRRSLLVLCTTRSRNHSINNGGGVVEVEVTRVARGPSCALLRLFFFSRGSHRKNVLQQGRVTPTCHQLPHSLTREPFCFDFFVQLQSFYIHTSNDDFCFSKITINTKPSSRRLPK